MDPEQFNKALEDIVNKRIGPLEDQLSSQQELIRKLSSSLQAVKSALEAKNSSSRPQKLLSPRSEPRSKKSTRSQPSEHEEENIGEATKDESEEHKE
jgi:hypothetical protein